MLAAATKMALTLLVLPLGDSITDGVPTSDGYRGFLQTELAAAGIGVSWLGSRRSRAGAHVGWSGFTTDELLPRLRATLTRGRPDVVLLHIGTNDLGLGVPIARAAANVDRLLEAIESRSRAEPTARPIKVLVAKIIGRNLPGDGPDHELLAYNGLIARAFSARKAAGQAVELVDMHAAIDPTRDLHDALHPSEAGYRKIASAWAAAVRRCCGRPAR